MVRFGRKTRRGGKKHDFFLSINNNNNSPPSLDNHLFSHGFFSCLQLPDVDDN